MNEIDYVNNGIAYCLNCERNILRLDSEKFRLQLLIDALHKAGYIDESYRSELQKFVCDYAKERIEKIKEDIKKWRSST